MFRPVLAPPLSSSRPQRWQETLARLIPPLTIWICVCVGLRYGYYGDYRMVLGPSSSRLMKASSVFVEQVEVRDDDHKGVFLYGFSEKPQLSGETNWTVSNFLVVRSYSRKGFSLWLNKGSRIQMRWETQASRLDQLQVVIIKGERKFETLLPKSSVSEALAEPIKGTAATEYTIEEDDRYYFGVINMNPRNIIMTMRVNVSSKIYDLTKAKNMCSTSKGSCRLKLMFPNTQFVIVTTPNNGDLDGWYIELSFIARVITYISVLGFVVIMIFLVLKYLGACDSESPTTIIDTVTAPREVSETDPLIRDKAAPFMYGTNEEDDDDVSESSSSSSEELYDAKLCVICYDDQRNCFFVPCGHCATCYDCAKRIMEGESKMCPICRRLIHKVRRLFSP